MAKKTIEDVLQQYALTTEGAEHLKANGINVDTPVSEESMMLETVETELDKNPTVKGTTISAQELFARKALQTIERPSMKEAHELRKEEIRNELASQGLGFIEIPVSSLPTEGLFYPTDTKIFIRAASGAELRHWSMTNELELSEIDDALNYVFERCIKVSFPTGRATFEDMKEIDRFYLILAIRDLTFPEEGQNDLKIAISEKDTIIVHKDNIQFIDLGEKIMKYYNPEGKCFTFPTRNKNIQYLNFYLPSVGVTQWLKSYIQKKTRAQEPFDRDFITIAPLLIKDHKGLNDRTYRDLIEQSAQFGNYEWSLISKVKGVIERAVTPKLIYIDNGGVEQETPLNFQGGIKAIFNLNLDDELDL